MAEYSDFVPSRTSTPTEPQGPRQPKWSSPDKYAQDVENFKKLTNGMDGEILRRELQDFYQGVDHAEITRLGGENKINGHFYTWLRKRAVRAIYIRGSSYGRALKTVCDADEFVKWTMEDVFRVRDEEGETERSY
jgi:hypothetical protein